MMILIWTLTCARPVFFDDGVSYVDVDVSAWNYCETREIAAFFAGDHQNPYLDFSRVGLYKMEN